MSAAANWRPDVMQVCRNGHVITDLLHTFPERARSHCERCGAATLDRCLTCGQELPGAIYVPQAPPVGSRRPPQYCSTCGAAFPWTERPAPHGPGPLPVLETLLRRLPRVARELRTRHGERPPFRVADEHDLEDLLRALLPLHFDDIRHESRTPAFAPATRTDFRLMPSGIVLAVKRATPEVGAGELREQLGEDLAYYQAQGGCRLFVAFVYDPEGLLVNPPELEREWAGLADGLQVRVVIAS